MKETQHEGALDYLLQKRWRGIALKKRESLINLERLDKIRLAS